MRLAGDIAHMSGKRDVYQVLIEKPEESRPQGKHRRRWEYNIEMGVETYVWVHLADDMDEWLALADMVKELWFP
jgi:hypothetical protein